MQRRGTLKQIYFQEIHETSMNIYRNEECVNSVKVKLKPGENRKATTEVMAFRPKFDRFA